jgi:hypothetical protein
MPERPRPKNTLWTWQLATRFEQGLNQLDQKCSGFKDTQISSKEKDLMLIEFTDAKRKTGNFAWREF